MKNSTVIVLLSLIVALLSAALVVQGFEGRARRHDICHSLNTAMDVMHGLVVDASTPPPGKTLTTEQVRAITVFQTKAFALIDSARC